MRWFFKFNRVKWYRWLAGEQNKNVKMPIHKNINEKWMKSEILQVTISRWAPRRPRVRRKRRRRPTRGLGGLSQSQRATSWTKSKRRGERIAVMSDSYYTYHICLPFESINISTFILELNNFIFIYAACLGTWNCRTCQTCSSLRTNSSSSGSRRRRDRGPSGWNWTLSRRWNMSTPQRTLSTLPWRRSGWQQGQRLTACYPCSPKIPSINHSTSHWFLNGQQFFFPEKTPLTSTESSTHTTGRLLRPATEARWPRRSRGPSRRATKVLFSFIFQG